MGLGRGAAASARPAANRPRPRGARCAAPAGSSARPAVKALTAARAAEPGRVAQQIEMTDDFAGCAGSACADPPRRSPAGGKVSAPPGSLAGFAVVVAVAAAPVVPVGGLCGQAAVGGGPVPARFGAKLRQRRQIGRL